MSIKTPGQIVRRYLPQLARRVHPDLFASNPAVQQKNLASFQELNALVSLYFPPSTRITTTSEPGGHQKNPLYIGGRGTVDIELEFYCRQLEEEGSPVLVKHTLTGRRVCDGSTVSSLLLRSISSAARQRLTTPLLAVSFLDLCEKSGVKVSHEDIQMISKHIQSTLGLKSTNGGAQNARTRDVKLREEFEQRLHGSIGRVDGKYGDEARDRLSKAVHGAASAAIPRLTYFHAMLTANQRSHAARALATLSPPLASMLSDIPILVSRRFTVTESGVVVIPWDFKAGDLEDFLNNEADEARKMFKKRRRIDN